VLRPSPTVDAAKTYIENLYKNQAKSLQQRMERRKAGGGSDTPHSSLVTARVPFTRCRGSVYVPCSAQLKPSQLWWLVPVHSFPNCVLTVYRCTRPCYPEPTPHLVLDDAHVKPPRERVSGPLARGWRTRRCRQGLTLVHFSPQRKHFLWDTSGTFSR